MRASDIKEIEGAGQQQVRTLGSNIGAFHLNLWLHSLVVVGVEQAGKAALRPPRPPLGWC